MARAFWHHITYLPLVVVDTKADCNMTFKTGLNIVVERVTVSIELVNSTNFFVTKISRELLVVIVQYCCCPISASVPESLGSQLNNDFRTTQY